MAEFNPFEKKARRSLLACPVCGDQIVGVFTIQVEQVTVAVDSAWTPTVRVSAKHMRMDVNHECKGKKP